METQFDFKADFFLSGFGSKPSNLYRTYSAQVQRYYYVTPTSYLELINSFKDVAVRQCSTACFSPPSFRAR